MAQARGAGTVSYTHLEKDLATPEYYPLSLNALTNACNQKSNRDPVMVCDEASVRAALESLRDGGLAVFVSEAGSRVLKFRHRLSDALNLSSGELAVLAVQMCIRDRSPIRTGLLRYPSMPARRQRSRSPGMAWAVMARIGTCLLYTSRCV